MAEGWLILRVGRMQKQLVSVIVPIYNAGEYLRDCLDSILSQTYEQIEVVLVDDKSVDDSKKIAKKYAEKDKRIVLISKPVNQGINPARRTGFEHATGDYIMFVDDDDVVSPNMIEDHLEALLKTGADISISKAFWWNTENDVDISGISRLGSGETRVLDKKLSYRSLITETSPFSDSEVGILWNKIHKRSFFEDYDWSLSNMPAEDFMTNAYLFNKINTVVYIDRTHYFHRINSDSTMDRLKQKKGANTKHKIDIFDALLRVAEVFDGVSKANGWNFDKEIIYFKYRYFYIRIKAFMSSNRFSEADFQKLQNCTSLAEIDMLRSDDFRRYISEFVYYPAIDVLPEITNFWGMFSGSADIAEFLEKQINQLDMGIRESYEHIKNLEVTIKHQNDILESLQSLRGSMFNFLGKVKHKIVKQPLRIPEIIITHIKINKLRRNSRDCWVVMDRIDGASDNGYAFYKYLIENHLNINAYFVINEDSKDVPSLRDQGFKLVFIGTKEHKIIIENSSRLFYAYFTFEYSNSKARRFFLGHGITKDNLPNPGIRPNDYFLTALDKEQEFLSERTDMKAIKVGLPRYERLVKKIRDYSGKKDKIIVAPTWRLWLYSNTQDIKKDKYFVIWQKFLDSKELRNLSDVYEIIFILHPMMMDLNNGSGEGLFTVPSYVKTETYASLGLDNLQNLLVKTELLITDFSSVSFDAVIAGANVVYFQFDEDEYRTRGVLKAGWFNYAEDGFGPVYYSYEDFIAQIKHYGGVVEEKYWDRSQSLRKEVFGAGSVSERIVQLAKSQL